MGNELYFIKVGKTKYVNDLTKQGILHLSLAEEFRNRKKYGGKKYDSEKAVCLSPTNFLSIWEIIIFKILTQYVNANIKVSHLAGVRS